jgi:DNA-binding MarR family transcriptional regulator
VPPDTLTEFDAALAAFFRAGRRARGRANSRTEKGEMSLAQLHLVEPLLEAPQPSARLAENAGVTAATASRMIDALARAGAVERVAHPEDRRCVPVRLTAAGRRAALRKREQLHDARARMAEALEPEDRERVAAALLRLADVLEEL